MSTTPQPERERFEQDGRQLRQFVSTGSEEAFAAIMRRHLPFVYATCQREICNAELAQDATQAVFLLLARKAPTLRNGTVLAAWLFQAARFTARDLLKKERRRMRSEQRAGELIRETVPSSHMLWSRTEPLLNDALVALNRHEREAVLLRYVEELSLSETGEALGVTENAARMRVTRALEKMRRHLSKGGVVISASALAALLTERAAHSMSGVPESLNILAHVEAGGSLLQALASPSPTQIVQGVEHAMKIAIWKTAATIGLAASVILGGVTLVYSHPRPHGAPGQQVSNRSLAQTGQTAIGRSYVAMADGIVPAALANLTLPRQGAWTFAVTSRDVSTPEMKAEQLHSVRLGYDDAVKKGQMTQQQADDLYNQIAAGLQRIPQTYRYRVTLSQRDGKFLLLSGSPTPAGLTLPAAYVYDGQTYMRLYRTDTGLSASVGDRLYVFEAWQLLPLPGVGLPQVPLFIVRNEDAAKGDAAIRQPADGQTLTLKGEIPSLGVVRRIPDPAGPPYFEGELSVRWEVGQPQALEARVYITDYFDGVPRRRIIDKWEFSDHRQVQGVWLAFHTRHTQYDIHQNQRHIDDWALRDASATPLPADRFVLENYLGQQDTGVDENAWGDHVAFMYDPSKGTLQQQLELARRMHRGQSLNGR